TAPGILFGPKQVLQQTHVKPPVDRVSKRARVASCCAKVPLQSPRRTWRHPRFAAIAETSPPQHLVRKSRPALRSPPRRQTWRNRLRRSSFFSPCSSQLVAVAKTSPATRPARRRRTLWSDSGRRR